MIPQAPEFISKAQRGLARQLRQARDQIEWRTAHAVRGNPPWCRNRWGQRYQALSLSEYHYLRDGNPETHEARLLESLLAPGMTVVDVGANHGLFTLEAAHFIGPSGTIHAFEPAPATRERLKANLKANGLEGVHVFDAALGDHTGSAALRVHHEWTGLNTLAREDITWNRSKLQADEIVEVPLTSLDAHAREHGLDRIDFLKIDVEGFELAVLRGARELLAGRRVRWVLLEVGDVTCANAHVDPRDLLNELGRHGYELHAITSSGTTGPAVSSFPKGSFSANFLGFIPG